MAITVAKGSAIGAFAGGVLGCAAMFIYGNLDPLERMAAVADGYPLWSVYQLPFTAPAAFAGAMAGFVIALLTQRLWHRASTG
jgi:glutamate/tyrosine decarboxylase-like PLP-dependent enzyme